MRTLIAAIIAVVALGTVRSAAASPHYWVIWDPSAHAAYLGNIYDVLASDRQGNLYGEGGANDGQLFALEPRSGFEPWKGKIIYRFGNPDQAAGIGPSGGLTILHDTLFGTASGSIPGCGAAFRIDNLRALSLFDLHIFEGIDAVPVDGCFPESGLTFGLHGLLYGTAQQGGDKGNAGVVFAVSPSEINLRYAVIHHFGHAGDASLPTPGRLAVDTSGALYGVTTRGGTNGAGAVFMLQNTGGVWREQVLYSFQAAGDVNHPLENVVLDAQGSLYGCAQGGAEGNGGVFEISPPAQPGGAWAETVIHNFTHERGAPIATNGFYGCGITIDPATDRLFGTSYLGGEYGYGTIFELDPSASQSRWKLKVLHSFDGSPKDGRNPVAAPLKVGETYFGGNVAGTVYAFTP